MSSRSVVVLGLLVHVIYFFAILDVYYRSSVTRDIPRQHHPNGFHMAGPAKRLVLFSADGLRAESFYQRNADGSSRAPFLQSLIDGGKCRWGVSHTRVPTESRPGHVAMIAGLHEDVSAVTKGWTDNPVDFDSVFNQSSHTIAFGSPDILDMFTKRSRRVTSFTYDTAEQDFAGDATKLDTWVFDKVDLLLEAKRGATSGTHIHSRKFPPTLTAKLDGPGSILFLHLLGLDTHGHGSKPHSVEYIDNIGLVDRGVANVVHEISDLYSDQSTAFVFTSDHGMTDWGSHGMGLPHETETPLLLWGAGVKARVENNPGRPTPKMDVEQADIAPIMTSLLGLSVPMHSVGKLPVGLINMPAVELPGKYELEAIIANRRQISELWKAKRAEVVQTSFSRLFKDFPRMTSTGYDRNSDHISTIVADGKLSDAVRFIRSDLDLILDAHAYFCRYDRPFLSTLIVAGFFAWFIFVLNQAYGAQFDPVKENTPKEKVYLDLKPTVSFFASCLMSAVLLYILNYRWTVYVYVGVLFYFVTKIPQYTTQMKHMFDRSNIRDVIIYIFLVELLVLSFFHRSALTCLMLGIAAYYLGYGTATYLGYLRGIADGKSIFRLVVLAIASIFPLLHPIGATMRIGLVAFTGLVVGVVLIADYVSSIITVGDQAIKYVLHRLQLNSASFDSSKLGNTAKLLHSSLRPIGAFIAVSAVVTYWTNSCVVAKQSPPILSQVFSWSTLLLAPFLPKILRNDSGPPGRSLETLCLIMAAFYVPYLLLSIDYEATFYPVFCILLLFWRESLQDEDPSYDHENSVSPPRRRPTDHDSAGDVEQRRDPSKREKLPAHTLGRNLNVAYCLLALAFYSFFGTGNLASLNSFNPSSVQCFLTVFNPFAMGSLLMLKLMIPFFLIVCTLRSVRTEPRVFWLVLALSDVMAVNFFLLLKDEGSWLDIGTSISHYVISMTTTSILLLFYAVSAVYF